MNTTNTTAPLIEVTGAGKVESLTYPEYKAHVVMQGLLAEPSVLPAVILVLADEGVESDRVL